MRYDLKNQFSSLHIIRYNFSIRGKALKFYVVKFQSFASNRKVVSDNMQARKLVFFFVSYKQVTISKKSQNHESNANSIPIRQITKVHYRSSSPSVISEILLHFLCGTVALSPAKPVQEPNGISSCKKELTVVYDLGSPANIFCLLDFHLAVEQFLVLIVGFDQQISCVLHLTR